MLPGPAHALAGAWFELSRRSERTAPREGVQSQPEKSGGAAAVAAGAEPPSQGNFAASPAPRTAGAEAPSSAWVGPARARGGARG